MSIKPKFISILRRLVGGGLAAFLITLAAPEAKASIWVPVDGDASVDLDDSEGWLWWYSIWGSYNSLNDFWSDPNVETAVNELTEFYDDNVWATYHMNLPSVPNAAHYEFYADDDFMGTSDSPFLTYVSYPYWEGYISYVSGWAEVDCNQAYSYNSPPGGMSWGEISMSVPQIQAGMIVTDGPLCLGLTIASATRKAACNCTDGGREVNFAFKYTVTTYVYDMRINNNSDRNDIIAAEGEHVNILESSLLGIQGESVPGPVFVSGCETQAALFEAAIDYDIQVMLAAQAQKDESGGPHPTLANQIIGHGGINL